MAEFEHLTAKLARVKEAIDANIEEMELLDSGLVKVHDSIEVYSAFQLVESPEKFKELARVIAAFLPTDAGLLLVNSLMNSLGNTKECKSSEDSNETTTSNAGTNSNNNSNDSAPTANTVNTSTANNNTNETKTLRVSFFERNTSIEYKNSDSVYAVKQRVAAWLGGRYTVDNFDLYSIRPAKQLNSNETMGVYFFRPGHEVYAMEKVCFNSYSESYFSPYRFIL